MTELSKLISLSLLTLLVGLPARASVNINTEVVQKSVVYIYASDANGQVDPEKTVGTGFLVSVPAPSLKGIWLLLVTARHVLDPTWAHCAGPNPSRVFLRLNTKDYDPKKDDPGVAFVPLTLEADAIRHHTDPNADVAVVLLNAKAFKNLDASSIAISDFATDEELKRRLPSDPVLSAGMMLPYPGVKRNYPVFKFGHISTRPDELIPCPCVPNGEKTLMRLWFLSINLMPGNSGSPIFYVPEGANNASFGTERASLIGLQSIAFLGFDVAGMTPVQYIFETIEAMKLKDADLYRGLPQKP